MSMGEVVSFKLSEAESFEAKLFRVHHKRQGCISCQIFGRIWRKPGSTKPTYSYIFDQGKFKKYIQCNICGEQLELIGRAGKLSQ